MIKAEINELAENAKRGEREAFEKLYAEFSDKVYFFVKRCVGDKTAAEDITSETFVTAFEKISTLRSGESFIGWLYAIAYNKCTKHLKQQSRRLQVDSDEDLEQILENSSLNEPIMLPDDYAENEQTKQQLQSVIDSLPTEMRSAVILYYYDEMSVSEVAQAMQISENNVSQKLHRARKKIRSSVEKMIGKGKLFSAVPISSVLANLEHAGLLSGAGCAAAVTAAAVGIPVGLSKLSGGTSRHLLGFTLKYWSKHKKNLAALLFSGVLLCAVVCCSFLMIRMDVNRSLHIFYDQCGMYEYALPNAEDELVTKLSGSETLTGTINVYGKVNADVGEFEYGSLDDKNGLAHLPLESGTLPKAADEVAVSKALLKKIGYAGKVGDHITLDIGTFKLCGIISETYSVQRPTALYYADSEERNPYTLPLIYVSSADKTPQYTFTMIKNIALTNETEIQELFDKYYSDDLQARSAINGTGSMGEDAKWLADSYSSTTRLTYIFSAIAIVIAVLSVVAITRSVFLDRRGTIQMLRRIGLSRRRLHVMYTIECMILALVQTALGIAIGAGAYAGIYAFETKLLDQPSYSGFTLDRFVSAQSADPFVTAIAFSIMILPAGYLLTALLSKMTRQSHRRRKAASLWVCFAKVLRNRAVTVIQVMALSLICFATMFGYMLYTDSGKKNMNGLGWAPQACEEFSEGISFEKNGLEEYYSTNTQPSIPLGDLIAGLNKDKTNGIDDETADKLNAASTGIVGNSLIIQQQENEMLGSTISLGDEEETASRMELMSQQVRDFLDKNKNIYSVQTKLADKKTIESIAPYVVSGKIDIEKIASGEQIIYVSRTDVLPFEAGDTIDIGFVQGVSSSADGEVINNITNKKAVVGAVVKLPDDADNLLAHCVAGGLQELTENSDPSRCLLTTAGGARALGCTNASYSEIFSKEKIDGGVIPMEANMELLSYEQEKKKLAINKLTQYGGTALIIVLMSLLGFAAYFNSIGMKIRMKEYQLSVMRAVGTPLKSLRRRLMIDSIRIPVVAASISYAAIKLLQHINLGKYKLMLDVMNKVDEYDTTDKSAKLVDQFKQIRSTHFLENEIWLVKMIIPALVVFAVVCLVTALLTHRSVSRFDSNIAYSLSKGRKRR